MSPRTRKAFDCVAMKCDIQQHLLEEYEASGGRYDSYWHFLQETNRQNAGVQSLRQKLGFTDSSNSH